MTVEQTGGPTGHDGRAHPAPGVDRSVRSALPADAEDIARIQVASVLAMTGESSVDAFGVDVPAIVEQWRASLSGPRPEGVHTLVALHGVGIAGFAFCAPGEELAVDGRDPIPAGTDIHELDVDPNFARSGHGSRLLQAIADITDARCLRVWIGVDDDSRIRFFRSAGFEPAGLRRSLGAASGDTALVQHLWWATR